MRIRTKLALSFAGLSMTVIFLTLIMVNISIQESFYSYTVQQQDRFVSLVVDALQTEFRTSGKLSAQSLAWAELQAWQEEIQLAVMDGSGEIIWESPRPPLLSGLTESRLPLERRTPLILDGKILGALVLRTPPPQTFWSDPDTAFVNRLHRALIIVSFIALSLALIISLWVGNRFATPLIHMTQAVQSIPHGVLSAFRPGFSANQRNDEIGKLGKTLDHLVESLAEQENLRKTFTADLAHELRTPVSTIQGYLEAFIDKVWEPSQEHLETCHRETIRLKKLIEDLETLNAAEINLTYRITPVDLTRIVAHCIEIILPKAKEKHITLDVYTEGSLPILGDNDRLSQLVLNLLDNAVKYSPQRGRVKISLSPPELSLTEAALRIQDQGPGIAQEDIPYIFERFYRGDKSRTRLTGGAGIGLSLVKAIAQAHGATVQVESSSASGTCMLVIFPVHRFK